MILKEEKVILRSALPSDVRTLSKWWADGKVMAHAGFHHGIKTDEEALLKRIKLQNEQSLPKNQLLIIELEQFYPIGEMNYREVAYGVFEIGIKICVIDEQNKGFGAKAMKMLIMFLKNHLQAKKIVLDTNLNNHGAQRFYQRLGFTQIKIEKDGWKDQLGNLQSAVIFEMIL